MTVSHRNYNFKLNWVKSVSPLPPPFFWGGGGGRLICNNWVHNDNHDSLCIVFSNSLKNIDDGNIIHIIKCVYVCNFLGGGGGGQSMACGTGKTEYKINNKTRKRTRYG